MHGHVVITRLTRNYTLKTFLNNNVKSRYCIIRPFSNTTTSSEFNWSHTGFKDLENQVQHVLNIGKVQMTSHGVFENADKLKTELDLPSLWDDPKRAAKLTKNHSRLREKIDRLQAMRDEYEEIDSLVELALEEGVEENKIILTDCLQNMQSLFSKANKFRLELLLNKPTDRSSCFIEVAAGAGGTESMDFANMLLTMYQKWGEASGYSTQITEITPGPEAGIRNGILQIRGPDAYGWTKTESGVHRMVRISEYDTAHRRQTCFAQVGVLPFVEDDDDVDDLKLDPADLRIDRYRSSGPGGQHVNTTDSAIRITHIPTGIVAQSQNQRSQHQNLESAMKVLKARILRQKLDDQMAERSAFKASLGENAWGSQMRSYVLHPYKMVKDHRTNHETSQADLVLAGDPNYLTPFMEQSLMYCEKEELESQ